MDIRVKQNLHGEIDTKQKLRGTVEVKQNLSGSVHVNEIIIQEKDYYEGEYEVTPSTKIQTLETKEKTMHNDLVIEAIPYAEVTNSANGITVTIGGV